MHTQCVRAYQSLCVHVSRVRALFDVFVCMSIDVCVCALTGLCINVCVSLTGVVSLPQPEESEEEADGSAGGHGAADGVRRGAEQRGVLRHQVCWVHALNALLNNGQRQRTARTHADRRIRSITRHNVKPQRC